ncbi:hypothetical protein [Streptomyces sp. NPDC059371]|uniref:hypothetical protein n=1 Tax=Streptomyces sp. NPDC059371 TaxID=3346812 RepID=UPI00368A93B9
MSRQRRENPPVDAHAELDISQASDGSTVAADGTHQEKTATFNALFSNAVIFNDRRARDLHVSTGF